MRASGGTLRIAASDLTNFIACRHLKRLDAAVTKGSWDKYLADLDSLRAEAGGRRGVD